MNPKELFALPGQVDIVTGAARDGRLGQGPEKTAA